MARIISFFNRKGGVGKTTTVINFAAVLAQAGKRVLVVDCDPQANATKACNPTHKPQYTIYSAFDEAILIGQAITPTESGFDLLVGDADLAALPMEYPAEPDNAQWRVLGESLKGVSDRYDYILIDLPPELGFLSFSGLTAATDVLIPLQPEIFATDGTAALEQTIQQVIGSGVTPLNPNLNLLGIFITMYQSNWKHHQRAIDAAKEFAQARNIRMFDTIIRRCVKITEAVEHRQPAVLAYPKNKAVQAYRLLAGEVFDL